MKKLQLFVCSHRRSFGRWWEHFVIHNIEIVSSVVVLSCDTFGYFTHHYHTLAVTHQFAASGALIFLLAHLIRKYKDHRQHHARNNCARSVPAGRVPDLGSDPIDRPTLARRTLKNQ